MTDSRERGLIESAIDELERLSLALDSDPELIEIMPIGEVKYNLLELGLNLSEPLPDVIAVSSPISHTGTCARTISPISPVMKSATSRILFDAAEPLVSAKIKVIGVGGGGCNVIDRMIEAGVQGVEFIAANTDLQSLMRSKASVRIQMGQDLTGGLGAGGDPQIGRKAALEDTGRIIEAIEDADLVFVTAGLGGGTGTGASPIIASLASELGALTVAVVTTPFKFEGKHRREQADEAADELYECADSVITISNERLLRTISKGTSVTQAFGLVDEVLQQAVQAISDIIMTPGMINVDFADVRAVMGQMGKAVMGTGSAVGENRVIVATQQALSNPLLDEVSIEGSKALLVNVTGSLDVTLFEVHEAMSIIHDSADPDALMIFGCALDQNLTDELKITIIATGLEHTGGTVKGLMSTQAVLAFPESKEETVDSLGTQWNSARIGAGGR